MSEPASKQEIEDVLASIRRLVTSDPKPFARPESQPANAAQRLVLTPAHRVDESVVEDHGHGVDDALSDSVAEPEPEDAPPADAAEDAVQDVVQDAAEDVANETADHDGPNRDDDPTLLDRVAGLEAMVAARDEEWDPDGLQSENSAGPTEPVPWGAEQDPLTEPNEQPATEDPVEDPVEESVEEPFINAGVEALEGQESDTPPPHEQDAEVAEDDETAAADQYSAEWEDYDVIGGADDDADDDGDDDDDDISITAIDADDAVLDEEALRDLVAEIVRQELQGALGERITRNVRKLVRREIHRALAGQTFD